MLEIFSFRLFRSRSGFSLVELSIVLIIFGMLTAPVVAGRDMLKTAELRAVISEFEEYKVAIDHFMTQYEGLPGDLRNAESFWGQYNSATRPNGTFNGNNNARIDSNEIFRSWHQLALARLITGTYTSSNDASDDANIGVNVPASNYIGAGFSLAWVSAPGSWTDDLGRGFPSNYFVLGSETLASNLLTGSALKSEDAYYVDAKIDDGVPDFGNVLAVSGTDVSATDCVSSGSYNFNNTAVSCVLYVNLE